jgi:hypothetical protein
MNDARAAKMEIVATAAEVKDKSKQMVKASIAIGDAEPKSGPHLHSIA